MKIRNLLVLAIIGATAALFVPAQESDGSMTFTDELGQSITISRFGTVVSFKDSKGRVSEPGNSFRICASGDNSQCIDSSKGDGTSASLKAKFPAPGVALAKGQTLDLTATVHQDGVTVERRLTWLAGSRVVNIDETISASDATGIATSDPTSKTISLVIFEESGKGLVALAKPKTKPPGLRSKHLSPQWNIAPGKLELTTDLVLRYGQSVSARMRLLVP